MLNSKDKNNQPIAVYNAIKDGSLSSDPTNALSDKYGVDREVIGGRAITGDGSLYFQIIGLLATDTYTVASGSDNIIISNDRIDIANLDKVYVIKLYRAGVLIGQYNLEEGSPTVFNSYKSGLLPNGIIVNPTASMYSTQAEISYCDKVGFTLSDGVTYYENNNGTGLILEGVRIPRDESNTLKCCAYLANGTQADLVDKGENLYPLKFVNGGCFRGNSSAYFVAGFDTNNDWYHLISSSNNDFEIEFFIINTGFDDQVLSTIMSTTWSTLEMNGFRVLILPTTSASASKMLIGFYDDVGGQYRYIGDNPFIDVTGKPMHCMIANDGGVIKMYKDGVEMTVTALDSARTTFGETTNYRKFSVGQGVGDTTHLNAANSVFNVRIKDSATERIFPFTMVKKVELPTVHREFYVNLMGTDTNIEMVNQTEFNFSKQDESNYLQEGYSEDSVRYYPAYLYDNTQDVRGQAIDNLQTGGRFFDIGDSEVIFSESPELQQADVSNDLFELDGTAKKLSFTILKALNLQNDQFFMNVSNPEYIEGLRVHKPNDFATVRQLNTEKSITNN